MILLKLTWRQGIDVDYQNRLISSRKLYQVVKMAKLLQRCLELICLWATLLAWMIGYSMANQAKTDTSSQENQTSMQVIAKHLTTFKASSKACTMSPRTVIKWNKKGKSCQSLGVNKTRELRKTGLKRAFWTKKRSSSANSSKLIIIHQAHYEIL